MRSINEIRPASISKTRMIFQASLLLEDITVACHKFKFQVAILFQRSFQALILLMLFGGLISILVLEHKMAYNERGNEKNTLKANSRLVFCSAIVKFYSQTFFNHKLFFLEAPKSWLSIKLQKVISIRAFPWRPINKFGFF